MDGFKTIKPLSNFDVGDLCRTLPNFKGVFMRDELKSQRSRNECLIINYDIAVNRGTHWVCLYAKNGTNYYFDPFGLNPLPEVLNYCKKRKVYSSTFPIQKPNEVICGHYCVYMLHRLSEGDEFFDVLEKLYSR